LRQAAADAVEHLEHDARAFSSAAVDLQGPPSRGHWLEPGQEVLPPTSHIPRSPLPAWSAPAAAQPAAVQPPAAPPQQATPVAAPPSSPTELASRSLFPFPPQAGATLSGKALVAVRCTSGFIARADTLRAVVPTRGSVSYAAVMRRGRARELDEPLGGGNSPFVHVEGAADLMLSLRQGELVVLTLGSDFLFVREQRLVGFDATLKYESGRLPSDVGDRPPLVQLSGQGPVVFDVTNGLRALPVTAESAVTIRADCVVGWTGRLLPRPMPAAEAPGALHGYIMFSGDGAIFIDIA
jgi:uncharacterized protein (AIM24 family)